MVSTIRFRSFKTFDLQSRRSYPVLILFALGLAALAAQPEILLVVLAYEYLASAIVGLILSRVRRRPPQEDTTDRADRAKGETDTPQNTQAL
jgi:phosphatidylserine synthase